MKTYINPSNNEWKDLIKRPIINEEILSDAVTSILSDVKANGDKAIIKYASLFDGVKLEKQPLDSRAEISKYSLL